MPSLEAIRDLPLSKAGQHANRACKTDTVQDTTCHGWYLFSQTSRIFLETCNQSKSINFRLQLHCINKTPPSAECGDGAKGGTHPSRCDIKLGALAFTYAQVQIRRRSDVRKDLKSNKADMFCRNELFGTAPTYAFVVNGLSLRSHVSAWERGLSH